MRQLQQEIPSVANFQIGHLGFLKIASQRSSYSPLGTSIGLGAEPLLILLSVHLVVLVLHDLHGKTGNVDSDKPPLDHHV